MTGFGKRYGPIFGLGFIIPLALYFGLKYIEPISNLIFAWDQRETIVRIKQGMSWMLPCITIGAFILSEGLRWSHALETESTADPSHRLISAPAKKWCTIAGSTLAFTVIFAIERDWILCANLFLIAAGSFFVVMQINSFEGYIDKARHAGLNKKKEMLRRACGLIALGVLAIVTPLVCLACSIM